MKPQKPPKSTFPVKKFFRKFFYILISVDSKISPNFMETGGLLFFGPFGIAAPSYELLDHQHLLYIDASPLYRTGDQRGQKNDAQSLHFGPYELACELTSMVQLQVEIRFSKSSNITNRVTETKLFL